MKNHAPYKTRPLGAHLSIAGGIEKAISRAEMITADALQIFTRNQRQWNAPPLTADQEYRFLAAFRQSPIRFLCAHASYLCNLASEDSELQRKSRQSLLDELSRGARLGARCLVLHPGSAKGADPKSARRRIGDGLAYLLNNTSDMKIEITLENTAGQGAVVGSNATDLLEIFEMLEFNQRLSLCLDTAHAFAAGVDLRNLDDVKRWVEELRQMNLLSRVRVLHLNDSTYPCGSHKDRHTHIGEGFIGETGFRHILKLPEFRGIPAVLETPKNGKDNREESWDEINMRRLRELENDPG